MRVTIDPVTRLSSGLRISVELKDGIASSASSSGMVYRGFEPMLVKKDPMDAPYFTQRICGMCSASHATASVGAIESACGATRTIPKDALVVRNILNGLGWLKNHVEHLYMGFMPDLADPTYGNALTSSDLGRLLWSELKERYAAGDGGAYADAIRCVKLIGRAEGILGGRSPGSPAIVPGGVTARPTRGDIDALQDCMDGVAELLRARLLGALSIDDWLKNTHDDTSRDYASGYLEQLPLGSLSPAKGWGDLPLYMMFCSRMLARDTLELPAYLGLDTIGGYPRDDQNVGLEDQRIGFLNFGAFYRVRDDAGQFADGYAPAEDEKASSFQVPAGFTPGSMRTIDAAADRPDPSVIVEHVYSSFYEYSDSKAAKMPIDGETSTVGAGAIGYDGVKSSFIKAPRYGLVPCEVGPLARLINGRETLTMNIMRKIDRHNSGVSTYPMASVYTRILARMQETLLLTRMIRGWIDDDLGVSDNGRMYSVPVAMKPGGAGSGLIDAPRGALGHWLKVGGDGKISNYQVVAPTTWNASPRCSDLKNGPIELALLGGATTPLGYLPGSESNPIGLYHIVRSFDPCVSCAVHAIRR